jgi:hypothetical protein
MATASIDYLLFRFQSEPIPDFQTNESAGSRPTNRRSNQITSSHLNTHLTSHFQQHKRSEPTQVYSKKAQRKRSSKFNFAPAYRIVSPLFKKRNSKPNYLSKKLKTPKVSPSQSRREEPLLIPGHFKSLELWWLFAFPMVPLAFKSSRTPVSKDKPQKKTFKDSPS